MAKGLTLYFTYCYCAKLYNISKNALITKLRVVALCYRTNDH